MVDFLKSQFHFMLAYRFQNERGFVKTAWLDTFDRKFKNKSGTQTYTLYTRVASQYYNYQIGLTYSNSQTNRINDILLKLLESYNLKPDFTDAILRIITVDYLNKFNDSNRRYSDSLYEPLTYIHYQIDDFNKFINSLAGVLNMDFVYPKPRQINIALSKNINPPIIHPWHERIPILTHKKGYRGFVRDYDYITHW